MLCLFSSILSFAQYKPPSEYEREPLKYFDWPLHIHFFYCYRNIYIFFLLRLVSTSTIGDTNSFGINFFSYRFALFWIIQCVYLAPLYCKIIEYLQKYDMHSLWGLSPALFYIFITFFSCFHNHHHNQSLVASVNSLVVLLTWTISQYVTTST